MPPGKIMDPAAISIVVPVLNEAAIIEPFLRQLRGRAPGAQIIVADGGSEDGTAQAARPHCDALVLSQRGRAAQMNAGANLARGEVLWFLHADCEVPPGSLARIAGALGEPHAVGGYFRVRLPRREWIYRVHDSFGHHVGVLLRVRCGDHGIFCRRGAFQAVGGYRSVPIMEDVELYRSLRRVGRVVELPERLIVSTRRHEQVGPYQYTAACALVVALYCAGASLDFLARLYPRLISTWRAP